MTHHDRLGDVRAAGTALVDELCARDTRAARTRMLLLRLEKQGHKLGWDHPDVPGVFQVHDNPRSGHVEHHWSDPVTDIIDIICERNGGHVGNAFLTLAECYEALVQGRFNAYLSPDLRRALHASQATGADLWPGERPGWRFYGYGFRCESWMVSDIAAGSLASELSAEHRLHEHPDRVETRDVWFIGRDGLVWWASRHRGEQPTVYAQWPEADNQICGGVANGLSRITNAVAGNPVPVLPADRPVAKTG